MLHPAMFLEKMKKKAQSRFRNRSVWEKATAGQGEPQAYGAGWLLNCLFLQTY
jgi:hypothetical protein